VTGPILDGEVPPGRYRLPAPLPLGSLLDEIAAAGWLGRLVDGASMGDRDGLFDEFAAALEFPSWFGRNWDAFLDCLRDLSWLRGRGVIVLWRRAGTFASVAPQAWRDANNVIDQAIASRVEIGLPPLYVLLPARTS
jgi:RNAse (barnase) inhibitor barstar